VAKGVLDGCRVLLTRPADQAGPWRRALAHAGAAVVDYPTTVVGPPPSWAALDSALARLPSYDWLVFSSATAARFVGDRWPAGIQRAGLARPLIAAVGDETARALEALGLPVALVPVDQRQEGLVAAFRDLEPGTRVLFPRAKGGRDHLVTALADAGIQVDLVPASQTVAIADLPPLPTFDVATFASPSALDAFVDRWGTGPLARGAAVAVGSTTAAAASARGLAVVTARAPNIEAVIEAIAAIIAVRPGQT
jgi:uroporphyrinogen III methyltransferase/synthase